MEAQIYPRQPMGSAGLLHLWDVTGSDDAWQQH